MSDPRFTRLHTDPRFRRPKRNTQKVVVDERFKAVFDDDSNKKSGKRKSKGPCGRVDKYGRQVADTHEKDNLRRFYRLEGQNDDEEHEDAQAPQIIDYARGQVLLESSDEEDGEESAKSDGESEDGDDADVILGQHASKPIPVFAEDDGYLEVDLNEDEDAYADLDAQAASYANEHAKDDEPEQGGVKTNRLAVVNLDWDHVRASHLYKIFSSLVSPTAPSASVAVNGATSMSVRGNEKASSAAKIVRGKILSVRVYLSEFGKERLKKEEVEGPPKEIFKKSRRRDEDDTLGSLIQEDEGDEFDEKALRKYQLERLRYYYAIVICDTLDTAAHLVSELDGTELERSANVFDLSYVPDDMTFDDDFRDEATPTTESTNTTYKGLDFSTDALRHSKVTLKWDEDDPERSKVTRRALSRKEIEEGDYRAYIAPSSSEDSDDIGDSSKNEKSKTERERLRKLLLGDGEVGGFPDSNPFSDGDNDAEGDMEITFMPGLSEANAKSQDETTIETYKRKQKEKRQARKKEKIEKMSEKEQVTGKTAKVVVGDEFFAAGSESEEDEADLGKSKNKKSKSSKSKSRREEEKDSEEHTEARPATEAELELLVAPDDTSTARNHFDMKSILKAEKAKGKKKKKSKKSGKKGPAGDGEDDVQEDFQIDVKDDRFKALHEDHTFAIDPSNPHFKKTKSMAALLEERAKRQSGKGGRPTEREPSRSDGLEIQQSLQSLVDSVKRKSSHADGKGVGKRRKL
ncbi:uncharacterized protein FOMMEDRAFT_121565 [Fomitiporia mediterranea MF3/22]|uniref:uncharacterized protein n=1 Tax=Fomitiporia mediterranea (strain MF3/22) TaxID=694068 RepID=UPI00044097B8|nr:uncharacterized protein FOMMEDRAFT_121565 [Fomitiporia mediterranea MF3/22]EJD04071.1 hypothetical protein FOMMEDRAFT_121565 [Fomitiporia mediterranea MF3/22]